MNGAQKTLGSGGRLLATVALVMAVTLQLFLIHMVIRLHGDLEAQRDELATKRDLVNLAVNLGPPDPAMTVLNGTCTECHTKERFAEAHGITGEIPDLVDRMRQLAGPLIDAEEVPKIQAALTFMKCAHCHSGERLKEMAILSPRERWDMIMQMAKKPGGTISEAEARRIRDFYGSLWEWHAP